MIFYTRAYATPEGIKGSAEIFFCTHAQGCKVTHHAALRMLRRKNIIIKRSFIEIKQLSVRLPAKKMPRKLHHVVGVASLGRILAQVIRKFARFGKVFVFTIAAHDIGMLIDHRIPEKFGNGFIFYIPG
jgi:hypothetical protein